MFVMETEHPLRQLLQMRTITSCVTIQQYSNKPLKSRWDKEHQQYFYVTAALKT